MKFHFWLFLHFHTIPFLINNPHWCLIFCFVITMLSSLFIFLSGLISMLQCIKGRQSFFFTFYTSTFCHLLSFCLQPQQCPPLLVKIMVCHIFFSIYRDKLNSKSSSSCCWVYATQAIENCSAATYWCGQQQPSNHAGYFSSNLWLFLFYCIYLT